MNNPTNMMNPNPQPMTETTPKPAPPTGDYVTKSEFQSLSDKIDKLLKQLS